MPTRIDKLTPKQEARFGEWRDKWIEIGLSTAPAERPRFEAAVATCYRAAGLEAPKRIVWVPSPLVMAIAAPVASLVLELRKKERPDLDAVIDAVDDAVNDAVRGAVRDAVGVAVRDAVAGAVSGAVAGAVYGAVLGAVGVAVDVAVRGAVEVAVSDAVGVAVRDVIRGSVGGAVSEKQIRKAVADVIARAWPYFIGGQFWVGGWYWGSPAFVSFFRDICGLDLRTDIAERAKAYEDTASSACWWWPHREFVMVVERPHAIARDAQGRLHREDGPAAGWQDWGVHAWHGVRVPADVIERPESLTAARIDAETNAEIRRVMLERFGVAKYLRESGAEVLHEDKDPLGFPRRLLRREVPGDEPIVMVELTNSTPEPDGTRKLYHLRVHPELRPMLGGERLGEPQAPTAQNAVASTMGMRGEEYHPKVET